MKRQIDINNFDNHSYSNIHEIINARSLNNNYTRTRKVKHNYGRKKYI